MLHRAPAVPQHTATIEPAFRPPSIYRRVLQRLAGL